MATESKGRGAPRVTVAVDLGGTRFRIALVTDEGGVLQRVAEPTRVHEGLDTILQRIYATIRHLIASEPHLRPGAVAVAAPGPLNPWTGILYYPPNMPGWDEVPLKTLMEREFALPVAVGNDANVAALGEHRFGAGRGLSDIVYLTVSTGIGGGIISDNRLVLGSSGLAGEIGHTTIVPNGPLCGCGNYGCLEALSSGTAIARRAVQEIAAGATTAMLNMAGGDSAKINAELVEAAAKGGDALANKIMREAAEHLGIGVANVVSLFNPRMVVIGGGVSRAGALLFQPVWEVVTQRVMLSLRTNLQIVPAQLGDDAGLLGCAALAETMALQAKETK